MTDTTFRDKIEPVKTEPEKPAGRPENEPVSDVKVADDRYTLYEVENKDPYLVKHFELDEHWRDEVGGFSKEIGKIKSYIDARVKKGEIDNSVKAVSAKIKDIERMANIGATEGKIQRIAKLNAFIEFLEKIEHI